MAYKLTTHTLWRDWKNYFNLIFFRSTVKYLEIPTHSEIFNRPRLSRRSEASSPFTPVSSLHYGYQYTTQVHPDPGPVFTVWRTSYK